MNGNEQEELRCGRYVIAVLASVLHKTEAPALPEGLTWAQVYDTARSHAVDAMVLSAVGPMVRAEGELYAAWSRRRDEEMVQTLTQMSEEPRLLAAFSQAGLRVMPVKGSALRAFYPRPDLRQMSDIDLVVPSEERAQAAALMLSLGYQAPGEDFAEAHEASFALPPFLSVELHDSPVKPEDPRVGYYESIWARAQPDAALPGVFHLSREDEYLYLLVHFIQHYEDAGIGIRQVMDVCLFRQACGAELDGEYLDRETAKMGIRPMRQAIEALADHCFSGQGGADPELEEMEDYCILSGAYGTHRSRSLAIMRKTQSSRGWKLRYLWRRLFPPVEELCRRYPEAAKMPWLLPVCWLRRLLDMSYWKGYFRSEMSALVHGKKE